MEQYQLLRIYFKYGQKSRKLSFWQKLWNNNLSTQLLKAAKEQKIHQANIFNAKAGYLGEGYQHRHGLLQGRQLQGSDQPFAFLRPCGILAMRRGAPE